MPAGEHLGPAAILLISPSSSARPGRRLAQAIRRFSSWRSQNEDWLTDSSAAACWQQGRTSHRRLAPAARASQRSLPVCDVQLDERIGNFLNLAQGAEFEGLARAWRSRATNTMRGTISSLGIQIAPKQRRMAVRVEIERRRASRRDHGSACICLASRDVLTSPPGGKAGSAYPWIK
jgi:hypothetical protein